jgi:O-antigen ligase
MAKAKIISLLGLYFFSYTIPQYIPNLYYAYDRVTVHLLFLSILNVFTFLILVKSGDLIKLISIFKNKIHFYSYSIFILISCFSLFVADNLVEGLVTLTSYLIYFISFILIVCIAQKIKKILLKTFLMFTLIAVFMESGWINYLIYDSVVTNGNFLSRSNDFSGFTGNINISSFSLALKVPILLYIIFKSENRYMRSISLVFIFSSFLSILLLFSRAAIIALIFIMISLSLLLIINKTRNMIKKYIYVICFIFLSFISYGLINDKNPSNIIVDRFSNVISNPGADGSVNERLNFYSTAVNSIFRTPLTGIGVGNWKINSVDYSRDIIAEYRVPYFVHNDFLQITAEIGIIGGLAFIYFIFYPFFVSLKKSFYEKDFNLYFMIYLIMGVYIIDSLLNFPIGRVITVIFLLFTIMLFYILTQNFEDEK